MVEINRLLRTNTFNKKVCWDEFVAKAQRNPELSRKKKRLSETDFKGFRRSLINEKSDIRPYVNNRSCFRTKLTRSPVISLLYPTSEYASFNLSLHNAKLFHK
jgi:hypothetical protein